MFLAIAYAATVAVVVWQRWSALAWVTFATVTLEWVAWLYLDGGNTLAALIAFGALTAVLAFGLETRTRGLSATAAALVPLSALILAAIGADDLDAGTWFDRTRRRPPHAWARRDPRTAPLARVRADHARHWRPARRRRGRDARRRPRARADLGGLVARVRRPARRPPPPGLVRRVHVRRAPRARPYRSGGGRRRRRRSRGRPRRLAPRRNPGPPGRPPPAASPRAATPAGRPDSADPRAADSPRRVSIASACDSILRPGGIADWVFAAVGLVVQLALAIAHVLAFDAPLTALGQASVPTDGLVAVAAVGVVAFLGARIADRTWTPALDALALVALAHFTGLALHGLALTVALAAEAVALSFVLRPGAIAFAGLALAQALVVLAPPIALLDGLDQPFEAAVALLAATVALAVSTRSKAATALALLYLASVEIVTAGGPEHTGQTLLSVLWAVAGVGTLIFGLLADERNARRGALILLAVTGAKVFLYDLSELDQLYRVGCSSDSACCCCAARLPGSGCVPDALQ